MSLDFILSLSLFISCTTNAQYCQPTAGADPDLTCGATNHPCILPETYNAYCDIKCDSTHTCSGDTYWLAHNIFCDGQYSCYGKNIYSYNDADSLDTKSYICCNGYQSCSGVNNILHSPDDDIYCGGDLSCYQSTITNTDDDIHCQGYQSCAYATLTANDDNVYCGGYESCKDATIITLDDNIECCNTLSCSYARMYAMEKVKCTSYQSCLHSTITFLHQYEYQDQTLECSGYYGNSCDGLIASCINTYNSACKLILPSGLVYQFTFYADRMPVYGDPTQIYLDPYLTLRFQLKLTNRPVNEYYVLSISSQPYGSSNYCFYPQIKMYSTGISIEYGCPGYITSRFVTVWNDWSSFPTELSIYVWISRDFSYPTTSTVYFSIGSYCDSFNVNGGYDNGASGNVYIGEVYNYFNVKQVIINSQPTYISDAPSIPNNNVIYNNKYLTIFLFIFMIFLFISLFSITSYNWKNHKKPKQIYQQVPVTDSEIDSEIDSTDVTN